MFNGYRVYTLQETRAIYRIDNVILIVWKKKDSGRNTVYKKSREYIRFVEAYLSLFLRTCSAAKFLVDAMSISSEVKDRQRPALSIGGDAGRLLFGLL